MKNKPILKSKLPFLQSFEFTFYLINFIILTLPRSLAEISPNLHLVVNTLKVISFISIILLYLIKSLRPSKLTLNLLLFSGILGLSTIINSQPIIFFVKAYSLNIAILLLMELIIKSELKSKFLQFFPNYFLILLSINVILIIHSSFLGIRHSFLTPTFFTYFLGQDNRFILYILPTIIGFYYLYKTNKSNLNLIKLILTFAIGLFSLGFLWSVSAFVVLSVLFVLFFLVQFFKFKITLRLIIVMLFIINFLLVFFKINHFFDSIIVNLLRKTPNLSYRTILWDYGISTLSSHPFNYIYGFGYQDITKLTIVTVSHFHNIFINALFYSGIIGLLAYFNQFFIIAKSIIKTHTKIFNALAVTLASILVLMLFDTFEYYQIYYFILALIFYAPSFITKESHV